MFVELVQRAGHQGVRSVVGRIVRQCFTRTLASVVVSPQIEEHHGMLEGPLATVGHISPRRPERRPSNGSTITAARRIDPPSDRAQPVCR